MSRESFGRNDAVGCLCRLASSARSCFSGGQAMHPGKKRDQSEITDRELKNWAHMRRHRTHTFTHFPPTFGSLPHLASPSRSPAQPRAHASQIASTPAQAHPLSAAHTPAKLSRARSIAPTPRCTHASQMASIPAQAHPLSPAHTQAVAKEKACFKIAKHAVNAP